MSKAYNLDCITNKKSWLLVGTIFKTHALIGQVKVKILSDCVNDPFTLPLYVFNDDVAEQIEFISHKSQQSWYICSIKSVTHIDTAEKMVGKSFYCNKKHIKLKQDEFLVENLIGVTIKDVNNNTLGEILKVLNFGASDILEISMPNNKTKMVPFLKDLFPVVNTQKKYALYTGSII